MSFMRNLLGRLGLKESTKNEIKSSSSGESDTTKDQHNTVIFKKLQVIDDADENTTIVFKNKRNDLPIIEVLEGNDAGIKYTLQGKIISFGRREDNQIFINDPNVSRYHARIIFQGEWQIEDLESTNGVFINGQRIKKSQLKSHDEILIGSTLMKFRLR